MTKEQFYDYWKENCGNLPPIGHILREHFFDDRWFRIHSLPNSKRYAENDIEMQIILDRQNTLLDDLIGEINPYLLLLSSYSEQPTGEWHPGIDGAVALGGIRLDIIAPEFFDDELYLQLAFANKKWKSGSINDYLKEVANEGRIIDISDNNINDDNSTALIIVDAKKNRIIAPYDGGVDIFLNNERERDYFKLKYRDWLSFTESGL